MDPLLNVEDLALSFHSYLGEVEAVRGVTFTLNQGETVALVGESGCGKSATAGAITRLHRSSHSQIKRGRVVFDGTDLLHQDKRYMRRIRGKEIGMIFQDPMTSLNPTMRIGKQIEETLRRHLKMGRSEATARALELLRLVEISDPSRRLKQFPHELSGGMRQRVMIAIALACHPKLLIADEPTTALDVTVQAGIMELLKSIQKKMGTTILLITHDLGTVARLCDRVLVMYAGKIIESGTVDEIFENPLHPYTLGLLASMPRLDQDASRRLEPIHGAPPSLLHPPKGCGFCNRCSEAMVICKEKMPEPISIGKNQKVRCWRHHEASR